MRAANGELTLVDVLAIGSASSVAGVTLARERSVVVEATCIAIAVIGVRGAFVDVGARNTVSSETGVAIASV